MIKKWVWILLTLAFAIVFNIAGAIILKPLFFNLGILPNYEQFFGKLPYVLPIMFLSTIYFYMVGRNKNWNTAQSMLFAISCFACGLMAVIMASYFN